MILRDIGHWGNSSTCFNLCTIWRWMVGFTLRLFWTRGMSFWCPFISGCVILRTGLSAVRKEKYLPLPAIETRFSNIPVRNWQPCRQPFVRRFRKVAENKFYLGHVRTYDRPCGTARLMKFDVWVSVENLSRKFKLELKFCKNNEYFTWKRLGQNCSENWNTFYVQKLLYEIVLFMR